MLHLQILTTTTTPMLCLFELPALWLILISRLRPHVSLLCLIPAVLSMKLIRKELIKTDLNTSGMYHLPSRGRSFGRISPDYQEGNYYISYSVFLFIFMT